VAVVRRAEGDALAAALTAALKSPSAAPLLRVVVDVLRPLLGAGVVDPWIGHEEWPFSRRRALRLAREGAFEVRLVGRRYLCRRSALDAFIEAHAGVARSAPVPANDAAEVDELDELAALRRELKLEPVAAPARRARGGR
jgi:hypothetical protein